MIVLAQAFMIVLLQWGLQSWVWVMGVPLAFGLAARVSGLRAAGRGAAAGGLAWLGSALYLYLTSGRLVAGRVAAMLGLPLRSGWIMVVVSGILAALAAGLAAYAGAGLRAALAGTEKSRS
ncbi:MAG: hypothetical protein JXO51_01885 [Candidatus Aminicenantes bacterium]|nr:hypothetical protein [Candidatus Aminicenantes bacterium]